MKHLGNMQKMKSLKSSNHSFVLSGFVDLKNRFIFLLLSLIIFRFCSFIPMPGVDVSSIKSFFQADVFFGFFSMFNLFAGGALSRLTIMSLGISPYIVASIIVQLSVTLLKNEKIGSSGIVKSNTVILSKCVTIIICLFHSSFLIFGLDLFKNIYDTNYIFLFCITIATLLGSTMLLVWIGDQISIFGIGNGISMIIFSGIVAELPSSLSKMLHTSSFFVCIILIVVTVFLLSIIVTFERASYNIPMQYQKKQVGKSFLSAEKQFFPIKINTSGLIPPIFASSFLMLPLTALSFYKDSWISNIVLQYFSVGSFLYLLCFAILIVAFSFFYSSIVFNSNEIAKNLKNSGAILPGIRPGTYTAKYLYKIVRKLNIFASAYLILLCVVPEFFRSKLGVSFFIGGTSIMILVNVIIDMFFQVQSCLFSHRYSDIANKLDVWSVHAKNEKKRRI